MARIKSTAVQAILDVDRAALVAHVQEYQTETRSIDADARYSPEHKRTLIQERRDYHAAQARMDARDRVRRYRRTLEELDTERAKAAAKTWRGIDANRVLIFERLVAGELARPDAGALGGKTSVERAAGLFEQYRRQSNREALLALDAAARRLAPGPDTEEATLHARLVRNLDEWRAEEEAPLREVEAKMADTQAALWEYSQALKAAEPVLTDYKPHPFNPVSPWAADLLGEKIEDYGGGLVTRDKSKMDAVGG